ncbi:hypothetical protein KFK09_002385 [Dendrobium nobile]|uniref:Uncharacterized protein n=1 Tax=Dendrobium nobile TaxID=94219 RepID=A0A8T3C1H6_DENNO|nr:hypothetical protein KFK09_002385 [Dendrobium nobile]
MRQCGAWSCDERSASEGAGLAAWVDTCRMWSVTDHMGARRGRGLVTFGRGLEAQGAGTEAQGAGGCTGRGSRARGALGLTALDAVRQEICREVELECRWTLLAEETDRIIL